MLVDRYGRHVSYLRLSITDRCDFRCGYCMAEEMTFLPRAQVLTLEECLRIASVFVDLGVSKVRVTGGEPLVRQNAIWLLEQLARLPGLNELVITTNGSQLDRFAPALRAAGVRRINLSLDTLRADRFREITRVGDLAKVLRGLDAAQAAGFQRLKINTVMMRGVNEDELIDLVEFVLDRGLDIAFIEEMPLGDTGHARQASYFSSEEALARLQTGGIHGRQHAGGETDEAGTDLGGQGEFPGDMDRQGGHQDAKQAGAARAQDQADQAA